MKLNRHFLSITSIFMLLILCSTTVFANGPIKVSVDDKILTFEAEPFIENGTTLVPMRKIFEELNADVKWVAETQQIIATNDNDCIILKVGSNIVQKNGVNVNLLVAPKIVNGSTYVPARFIAEALNAEVVWDNSSQTVIINTRQRIESQSTVFTDYVLYSTGNYETLARNILNGDVVYINGQYWATPDFANRIANAEIVYMNDVSNSPAVNNDRHSLADLNLNDIFDKTEWIEENSIFLDDLKFTYSVVFNPNKELVNVGYFYNNISGDRVYILWDMTKEFAEAQEAESVFNGIRIKKIEGKYNFLKEDLIKNGIIKK